MAPYNGALQMKAQNLILPGRSLVFQFSDFSFSGSFKCDKRRYFILSKKAQACLALVTSTDLGLLGEF